MQLRAMGYGEKSLTRAGSTNQDAVALLSEKVSLSEIAHKALADWCAFELEVAEVLCQGELGDPDLIFDRACRFFADFSFQ
jgi:hypothetical protein